MGFLDFLHPSVGKSKQLYHDKINAFNTLKDKTKGDYDVYNGEVEKLKNFSIYNAAIGIAVSMKDLSKTDFENEISKYDTPIDGSHMPKGISKDLINELLKVHGGVYVLNAIDDFENVGKSSSISGVIDSVLNAPQGIDDILYGFAIGGVGIIPGVNKILPGPVAQVIAFPLQVLLSGPAIALDIAISVFLPSVTIAKYLIKVKEVEAEISKLNELQKNLSASSAYVERSLVDQKKIYLQLCLKLDSISDQDFLKGLTPSSTNDVFLASMAKTFSFFGLLPGIRKAWENRKTLDPKADPEEFKKDQLSALPRDQFNEEQLSELIELVLQA
jgi:hypothetical protein